MIARNPIYERPAGELDRSVRAVGPRTRRLAETRDFFVFIAERTPSMEAGSRSRARDAGGEIVTEFRADHPSDHVRQALRIECENLRDRVDRATLSEVSTTERRKREAQRDRRRTLPHYRRLKVSTSRPHAWHPARASCTDATILDRRD